MPLLVRQTWLRIVAGMACALYAPGLFAQSLESTDEQPVVKEREDAKDAVFSGPQVGEALVELPVWVSEGKDKPSTKADLAERSQKTPVAIAFMHERSRPAFQLVRILSQFAELRKEEGLELYVVVLTDDRSSSEQWLGQVGGYFKLPTKLAVADGGIEGPGPLGLNRLVDMTVLVAKEGKITANFALSQVSSATDAPPILKAINEISGGGEIPDLDQLLPQPAQRRNAQR